MYELGIPSLSLESLTLQVQLKSPTNLTTPLPQPRQNVLSTLKLANDITT